MPRHTITATMMRMILTVLEPCLGGAELGCCGTLCIPGFVVGSVMFISSFKGLASMCVAEPDFAMFHYTGGVATGDMNFPGLRRGGGWPRKLAHRDRFPIR